MSWQFICVHNGISMYIRCHGLSGSVLRGGEECRSVLMFGCYTERWLEYVVVGTCFQSSGREYDGLFEHRGSF